MPESICLTKLRSGPLSALHVHNNINTQLIINLLKSNIINCNVCTSYGRELIIKSTQETEQLLLNLTQNKDEDKDKSSGKKTLIYCGVYIYFDFDNKSLTNDLIIVIEKQIYQLSLNIGQRIIIGNSIFILCSSNKWKFQSNLDHESLNKIIKNLFEDLVTSSELIKKDSIDKLYWYDENKEDDLDENKEDDEIDKSKEGDNMAKETKDLGTEGRQEHSTLSISELENRLFIKIKEAVFTRIASKINMGKNTSGALEKNSTKIKITKQIEAFLSNTEIDNPGFKLNMKSIPDQIDVSNKFIMIYATVDYGVNKNFVINTEYLKNLNVSLYLHFKQSRGVKEIVVKLWNSTVSYDMEKAKEFPIVTEYTETRLMIITDLKISILNPSEGEAFIKPVNKELSKLQKNKLLTFRERCGTGSYWPCSILITEYYDHLKCE